LIGPGVPVLLRVTCLPEKARCLLDLRLVGLCGDNAGRRSSGRTVNFCGPTLL
jgi:hypothetical protein